MTPEERLGRIAEAHTKDAGPSGLTSGLCAECNWVWPCPTHKWATSEELTVLDSWHGEEGQTW